MAKRKAWNEGLFNGILSFCFFAFFSGIACFLHWIVGVVLFSIGLPFIVYYFIDGAKEAKIIEEGVVDYRMYKDWKKKAKKGDYSGYIEIYKKYLHEYGQTGDKKMLAKANSFLNKALKENSPDAFYFKAHSELKGIGCPINTEEGIKDLLLASKMGSHIADFLLFHIFIGLTTVPNVQKYVDHAKGYDLAQKMVAKDNKDGEAMYLYGLCLHKGYGISANPSAAKAWYKAAIQCGYTFAQIELNDILNEEAQQREKAERARMERERLERERNNPPVDSSDSSLSNPDDLEDFFNRELAKKIVESNYGNYTIGKRT